MVTVNNKISVIPLCHLSEGSYGYLLYSLINNYYVDVIGLNKPSLLMFTAPDTLTNGEYNIEIRTKVGNKLKKGQLQRVLNVA